MPTRETHPNGAPCWIDLMTSDVDGIRSFYCQLFGWTAEEASEQFGGYFNFLRDGVRIAGCMPAQPDGVQDVWSVYLSTDDARKTVEAAAANGAQIIVPAMDVADMGTMAVLTDPTGAAIGIWQPGTHPGFTVVAEDGAPGWFELHTRDYDAAVPFYRDVFRWDTHVAGDTPEFRYTTFGENEAAMAGIMDSSGFLPEGVPAHWKVYFAVEDADAAIAKLVELGGKVVQPAEDTPYGRMAEVTDPSGAQFKLVGPNESMPAR